MQRRRQRGQVMPYVAFMVLILTAAALVVFDIGYLINSRIQSQNAADAAALAAVSDKINKHHMDSLMRAAMTQEAIIAQAEIRASQAVLVRAIAKGQKQPIGDINNPGTPGTPGQPPLDFSSEREAYRAHANLAYKHAVKLQRERLGLKAWYEWLKREGPTAVREAARVAYAVNMQGYDDVGDATLRQNIENVLNKNDALIENRSGKTQVGDDGIIYANENAAAEGMFGKSFVEIETHLNASDGGAALLRYLQQFKLTSNAAAQLLKRSGTTPLGAQSYVALNWYSPYLMSIEDENSSTQVGH